ncbi:MAG: hypothetical protein HYV05_07340, partial [Deltaproteobacteria bacterium]|nr:hypothetical protein [Deltaproteobacteria bacterium]
MRREIPSCAAAKPSAHLTKYKGYNIFSNEPLDYSMPSFSFLQLLAQTGFTANQQQGVLDLVKQASPLVQGVLYLLVLFSVVSWGIIFSKYRQVKTA